MPDLSANPIQLAAIPYRVVNGGVDVLLVTSRETKRWIVPKGWPMPGKKNHRAAAQEARDEAGVEGKIRKKPIGTYQAFKRFTEHFVMVDVLVYALPVEKELAKWKEQGQRQRRWMSSDVAAAVVDEPGLARLLKVLTSKVLRAE